MGMSSCTEKHGAVPEEITKGAEISAESLVKVISLPRQEQERCVILRLGDRESTRGRPGLPGDAAPSDAWKGAPVLL